MTAYYNEFDSAKAEWLRELMKAGVIANGVVDERSIADVRAGDLAGFSQWHFFAGIGIWSYALRLAGWPDDRSILTASCPCQPFSVAGKRKGTADERHLWPELARLVREVRPVVAFGEQVGGRDGLTWLDDVFDDLEGLAYTTGAVNSPACGYGAPHIRSRLYWAARLADSAGLRHDGRRAGEAIGRKEQPGGLRDAGGLADAHRVLSEQPARQGSRSSEESGGRALDQPSGHGDIDRLAVSSEPRLEERGDGRGSAGPQRAPAERDCRAGWLGDTECTERGQDQRQPERHRQEAGRHEGADRPGEPGPVNGLGDANQSRRGAGIRELLPGQFDVARPGLVNGFWAGADWVLTRPQRVGDSPSLRPAPASIFPLAHGIAGRVLALRGAGDGIVAPQAAAFIEACAEEWGLK